MPEKDCRTQIIAAARKRFAHFGYGKTTMAELAADCAMSPGNLYRFFSGKLDIAQAIATADYEHQLEHLRRAADRPGRGPREKLRDFLLEELRRTYNRQERDPRALELFRVVATERPQFSGWMQECERRAMVSLMQGSGDWQLADVTADTILSATMKFRHPQLWSRKSLSGLERELDGVLTLLVEGLSRTLPARTRSPAIA